MSDRRTKQASITRVLVCAGLALTSCASPRHPHEVRREDPPEEVIATIEDDLATRADGAELLQDPAWAAGRTELLAAVDVSEFDDPLTGPEVVGAEAEPRWSPSRLASLGSLVTSRGLFSTVTFTSRPEPGAHVVCELLGDGSRLDLPGLTTTTEQIPSGIYFVWCERAGRGPTCEPRLLRVLQQDVQIDLDETPAPEPETGT